MSIDPEVARFKARLIDLCADRKWKQKELAKAVGASQQAVSPWLDPKKPDIPKGKLMLALPAALGVSGHWLLTGKEPMTPPGAAETAIYQRGRAVGWSEAVDLLRRQQAAVRARGLDVGDPLEPVEQAIAEEPDSDSTEGKVRPA